MKGEYKDTEIGAGEGYRNKKGKEGIRQRGEG